MQEVYGIAAFRSRQQVLLLENSLRREGISARVITTPRDVALGCGLSVRFELRDARDVYDMYQLSKPGNLIGFYRVSRSDGHTDVRPLGMQVGYTG